MNAPNLAQITKNVKMSFGKRVPEILTGFGIAGMITATVLAVKATPKAVLLLKEQEVTLKRKPTKIETIKTAGPCYISAAVTGALSIACLIGANSVNLKRNTALAAAYTLSESTLKEYQDKVIEAVGEHKEKTIHDAVAKSKIEKNPVGSNEVVITGKGETLCYDTLSGRYFKSDIEKIRKAENNLNRQMRDDTYITLNEFYAEIGLPSIQIGDELGWNIDRGYLDLGFSSQLAEDGTPCLVIEYRIEPRYNYGI